MRPDYCPIGGEPCQSVCATPCGTAKPDLIPHDPKHPLLRSLKVAKIPCKDSKYSEPVFIFSLSFKRCSWVLRSLDPVAIADLLVPREPLALESGVEPAVRQADAPSPIRQIANMTVKYRVMCICCSFRFWL